MSSSHFYFFSILELWHTFERFFYVLSNTNKYLKRRCLLAHVENYNKKDKKKSYYNGRCCLMMSLMSMWVIIFDEDLDINHTTGCPRSLVQFS